MFEDNIPVNIDFESKEYMLDVAENNPELYVLVNMYDSFVQLGVDWALTEDELGYNSDLLSSKELVESYEFLHDSHNNFHHELAVYVDILMQYRSIDELKKLNGLKMFEAIDLLKVWLEEIAKEKFDFDMQHYI